MHTSNTVVRQATETDLPNIERHYGPIDNIGDPFCDPNKTGNLRIDWLVVAEVNGQYAGFLYWHLGQKPYFAPEVGEFAHIREVQVMERFQGKGVGKELMAYATERLKALGVHEIFLATSESNSVARHLYESLRFKEFRRQIHYKQMLDKKSD